MFVRFRERKNDAHRPHGVRASILCSGRCESRDGRRPAPGFRNGKGCPEKPRCRWRIGLPDLDLIPRRLLVSLIENRRTNGRPRQEHIADLGAIDMQWLPSFFAGAEPEHANAARLNLVQWFRWSIAERFDFWIALDERLIRLSNRLTADDVAKIRASIHARIPRPTDGEVTELKAAQEIEGWGELKKASQALIARSRGEIARHQGHIDGERGTISAIEPVIPAFDENIRKLQLRLAEGKPDFLERSSEVREQTRSNLRKVYGMSYELAKLEGEKYRTRLPRKYRRPKA
jgi:hypothetical protein